MVKRVLEDGLTLTEAAAAAGVSVRTAGKWARRHRSEGEAGLLDRNSAPTLVANATPEDRVQAIAAPRKLALTGPEIAELLEMATSTAYIGDPAGAQISPFVTIELRAPSRIGPRATIGSGAKVLG